jgi:hypothetical protein
MTALRSAPHATSENNSRACAAAPSEDPEGRAHAATAQEHARREDVRTIRRRTISPEGERAQRRANFLRAAATSRDERDLTHAEEFAQERGNVPSIVSQNERSYYCGPKNRKEFSDLIKANVKEDDDEG